MGQYRYEQCTEQSAKSELDPDLIHTEHCVKLSKLVYRNLQRSKAKNCIDSESQTELKLIASSVATS